MGFLSSTTLASQIIDLMEKFADHFRHHLKHVYIAWDFSMEERCRASFKENSSEIYVWLVGFPEELALAGQTRYLKQRDLLKMRQINERVVTAAGYLVLLDLILAGSDTLGSDKLNTVRQ